MKNKKIILPISVTLMLFFVMGIVSACSCAYLENTQAKMENAGYVFSGEVTNIKVSGQQYNEMQEITIQIMSHWKPANFPESVNLIVYSPKDTGASCGYNFEEGEEYLIYAYLDSETGKFSTNLCMGNLQLDKAQTEINELNEITNSTNPNPTPNTPKPNEEQNIFTRFFNWLKDIF